MLPLLFVVIPLGAALVIFLLSRVWERAGDLFANLATLSLFVISLTLVGPILRGDTFAYNLGATSPLGIHFTIDGLSLLMLITINLLCFMSSLYSVNYMERYTAKPRYYILLMLMIMGMNVVVLGADLVNLYIGVEIAAIACYALIAFGVEHEYLEASFKYQIMGTVATLCILLGIALIYRTAGTLNIVELYDAVAAAGGMGNPILVFSSVLFLGGFGLKAAYIPFHAWLPDAHSTAPTPVSAILSGVFIKVVGLYCMIKVFFSIIGLTPAFSMVLMVLGAISIIVAVLLALAQWDSKRLLAYSSIEQMGFILLGIGIGTPLGILGALFHLINHATFKSLLFLDAGSVETATGTRDLKELGGLNQRMPVTGVTTAIASFSISGFPPFNGFWSKLIIIIALVQAIGIGYPGFAPAYITFAVIALVGSILTMAVFLKLERHIFFGSLPEKLAKVREVPWLMCAPMIILAAVCIGVGIAFPWVIGNLLDPAVGVLSVFGLGG